MENRRKTDQPSPTIVGPRPPTSGGRKISVPNGIEQVLTLAAINPEWRGRILANAPRAAAEAGIHLTESETAIVRSLPPTALEKMIGSFAPKVPSAVSSLLAAGVASAALLAATSQAADEAPVTKGIQPDLPPPQAIQGAEDPGQAKAEWSKSLAEALAQARKSNQAILVSFEAPPPQVFFVAGNIAGGRALPPAAAPEVEQAAREARLQKALVSKPADPKEQAAYDALIKRYALQDKLPAVVILAPDGSELAKVAPLKETAPLVDAIRQTPPLLAKWIAGQRDVGTPTVTRGHSAGATPYDSPSKN